MDFKLLDKSDIPIFDAHLLGISFFINRRCRFGVDLLETEPYRFDGSDPMLFVNVGPFELVFYNKWLYTKLYKKRYGVIPREFREDK